jgi:hypothetical protein
VGDQRERKEVAFETTVVCRHGWGAIRGAATSTSTTKAKGQRAFKLSLVTRSPDSDDEYERPSSRFRSNQRKSHSSNLDSPQAPKRRRSNTTCPDHGQYTGTMSVRQYWCSTVTSFILIGTLHICEWVNQFL